MIKINFIEMLKVIISSKTTVRKKITLDIVSKKPREVQPNDI